MWLEIGKIVAAQGLQGDLRVYPNSDFPERFLQPGQRWLRRSTESEPEPIELLAGRYLSSKGLYVVRLAGVRTREQAEALRNSWLLIPATDRPPLEAGEFHVLDLIDLPVFDQATQTPVGTVIDVLSAGNDLLEVELCSERRRPNQATVLIPFVEAIVPVVDLEQGRIEITPPDGLL